MNGSIAGAVICWIISIFMGAIALWAFNSREPMHFWAGSTVSSHDISDIPAYNRANGIMWTIYAVCMAVSGVLALFATMLGVISLVIVCVPGTVILVIAYKRIYNKYKA